MFPCTDVNSLVDAVALHEPGIEVQDILNSRNTACAVNASLEHTVR